ncbi:hypothetical protein CPB84DRAFT_1782251 [Gymnopilus junonius]|uniref:Secreted protein n=1 Tax=Gymnopilus junonius TaxID=109634 RepID=A0A9P5NKH3_GYMJU|nr:hypothetical protein CPB84DRAFT_1782251 [Gymnopilus junonius]
MLPCTPPLNLSFLLFCALCILYPKASAFGPHYLFGTEAGTFNHLVQLQGCRMTSYWCAMYGRTSITKCLWILGVYTIMFKCTYMTVS